MKKYISCLLVLLALVLPMLGMEAAAAEIIDSGSCGENVTWTLDSDGLLTISGAGVIDDYYSLAWYSQRGSIRSAVVEEGVTGIDGAFYKCEVLSSVTLPESLTGIGSGTFSGCISLKSITIPSGVTYIGGSAFYGCSSLSSITIPDSVTSIGDYAFWYCSSLSSITIPEGITSISDYAFWYCGSLSSITIPEGITSIGNSAFYGCDSLRNITIPAGVTSIDNYAFRGCTGLSSITIPDSITSIGEHAFSACDNLKSVEISDIAAWCNIDFENSSSNPLCYASNGLYLDGELITSITLPDSVTSISNYAFYNCDSLSSITISDSVTSIGYSAFEDCDSLSSIIIPAGITSIDYSTFEDCDSLSNITLPAGITSIGDSAFVYCASLSSITLPASVTSIGGYAFAFCNSLSNITLPAGISSISMDAFYDCNSLAVVHYGGTEVQKTEIAIASGNWHLDNVIWHYECTGTNCMETPSTEADNPFLDVAEDAYYFEPVLWAVNKGITTGLTADSFGPDATCTRGQIVTFLWRSCGSPKAASATNPFTDVPADAWYADAVLWAVENGITTGTSATTFSPDAGCTRGQVATFLWRSQKQPASGASNIFTDIVPSSYYYNAVLWAVENGITNGVGEGTFAPDATCIRGQIVTFLYRAMV